MALRLRRIATTLRLPDAGEVLRRIEQVLLDASAVRIDFHQETRTLGKDVDVRNGAMGSLFFARGNKARLAVAPEKGKEILTVSDGYSARSREGDLLVPVEGLTAWLARSGVRVAICMYGPLSPWEQVHFTDEARPDRALEPTGLAVEAGDDGTATVTYTLRTDFRHAGLKVQLAFDPKTFLPKKRTLLLAHPKAEITIIEVYERVQINPELPDTTIKV